MTTWKLDAAHTQVNFSAKHMMVTTVRGTFHDVQGTIELDDDSGTKAELVDAYRLESDQVLLLRGAGFSVGDRVSYYITAGKGPSYDRASSA